MLQRKKKISIIDAEKTGILAEKGLNSAHLSRSEMITLANGGMSEVCNIRKGINSSSTQLEKQVIDKIMNTYFPEGDTDKSISETSGIVVRLTKSTVKTVIGIVDWQCNSPVFAVRGVESNSISFFKEYGKLTVHIEITKGSEKRSSIHIRLTDRAKRDRLPFDATLFQADQCIESIHVVKNPVASFSNIIPGAYILNISSKKGEIASIPIRLEA
jgi:hypothetical protein